MDTTDAGTVIVPKYIFIIPYRDREPHRVFFSTYIYKIMEDIPNQDWTFYFVHQNDTRPFNRGAMKNIGFLALKEAFPNHYKDIIFIFNDIDTVPYDKNILNYHTEYGVVKHFYGFQFALGGIFSIRGVDFERINGFPNYWAWGGEDNLINERAKQFGLTIDRSNFYTIGDKHILQFADGMKRLICRDELATSIMPNNADGLTKLANVDHVKYDETHMIDVNAFDTYIHYSQLHFEEQSLERLNKIRVSPLNALRNIKQLQSEYIVDANKKIHSVHATSASTLVAAGSQAIRKINGGVNTVNVPIQTKMPFMMNHSMMMGDRNMYQNKRLVIPKDRPIITEQERHNRIAAEAAAAAANNGERVYQNIKQHTDINIPLQRPNRIGIHNKQFGMRALFM
jgi:predicted regulator of Ras-like GTPase activity (Roadblock/LC7/MglB family)